MPANARGPRCSEAKEVVEVLKRLGSGVECELPRSGIDGDGAEGYGADNSSLLVVDEEDLFAWREAPVKLFIGELIKGLLRDWLCAELEDEDRCCKTGRLRVSNVAVS